MKHRRYSNEQIVYALKRVESGEKASEVKLVADLSLDKHILQEVLSKKV